MCCTDLRLIYRGWYCDENINLTYDWSTASTPNSNYVFEPVQIHLIGKYPQQFFKFNSVIFPKLILMTHEQLQFHISAFLFSYGWPFSSKLWLKSYPNLVTKLGIQWHRNNGFLRAIQEKVFKCVYDTHAYSFLPLNNMLSKI